MLRIKAKYDGKQIILPPDLPDIPPGEVIVTFKDFDEERYFGMKLQEETLGRVWDNEENAIYDSM